MSILALPMSNPTSNLALPGLTSASSGRRSSQTGTPTLNPNLALPGAGANATAGPSRERERQSASPEEEEEDEDEDEDVPLAAAGGGGGGGGRKKKGTAGANASTVAGASATTGAGAGGGAGAGAGGVKGKGKESGKDYRYSSEIGQMMFVFGEVQDPLPETTRLVEDIVRGQIIEIVTRARLLTHLRSSRYLSAEDLIFLIRDDRGKVNRLRTYLRWKEVRKRAKEDDGGAEDVELVDAEKTAAKTRKAMTKLPWEVLTPFSDVLRNLPNSAMGRDEEEDEDEDELQAYHDSMQRLRDADEITKRMTKDEYVHYSDCRQASFTYRKAKRFRDFINFGAYLDLRPNDDIVDILGFLAFEMVRSLCVTALEVRERMERAIAPPVARRAMGKTSGTGAKPQPQPQQPQQSPNNQQSQLQLEPAPVETTRASPLKRKSVAFEGGRGREPDDKENNENNESKATSKDVEMEEDGEREGKRLKVGSGGLRGKAEVTISGVAEGETVKEEKVKADDDGKDKDETGGKVQDMDGEKSGTAVEGESGSVEGSEKDEEKRRQVKGAENAGSDDMQVDEESTRGGDAKGDTETEVEAQDAASVSSPATTKTAATSVQPTVAPKNNMSSPQADKTIPKTSSPVVSKTADSDSKVSTTSTVPPLVKRRSTLTLSFTDPDTLSTQPQSQSQAQAQPQTQKQTSPDYPISLFVPPPSARQPLLPAHVLEAFAQIQREQAGARVGGMRNFRGGVGRMRMALV